jgi:hypothetical protein
LLRIDRLDRRSERISPRRDYRRRVALTEKRRGPERTPGAGRLAAIHRALDAA